MKTVLERALHLLVVLDGNKELQRDFLKVVSLGDSRQIVRLHQPLPCPRLGQRKVAVSQRARPRQNAQKAKMFVENEMDRREEEVGTHASESQNPEDGLLVFRSGLRYGKLGLLKV